MQVLVHPNRAGLLALCALIVGAANVPCCLIAAPTVAAPAQSSSPYTKGPKTRDGIGVYYFGREIAHYMTAPLGSSGASAKSKSAPTWS